MRIRLPSISYIVARSWPGFVIGCDNQLPWRLRSDLKRFKELTVGHVLLMGRKTLVSIGKPLPGRTNVVMSRNPEDDLRNDFWQLSDTLLLWAGNRENALYIADVISIAREQEDIFVIGGSDMFSMFEDLVNKAYVTDVFTQKELKGDAHWPYEFDLRKWKVLTEQDIPAGPQDEYPTRFSVYERRQKTVRYVDVRDYFTEGETRSRWIAEQMVSVKELEKNSSADKIVPFQYKMFSEAA